MPLHPDIKRLAELTLGDRAIPTCPRCGARATVPETVATNTLEPQPPSWFCTGWCGWTGGDVVHVPYPEYLERMVG